MMLMLTWFGLPGVVTWLLVGLCVVMVGLAAYAVSLARFDSHKQWMHEPHRHFEIPGRPFTTVAEEHVHRSDSWNGEEHQSAPVLSADHRRMV